MGAYARANPAPEFKEGIGACKLILEAAVSPTPLPHGQSEPLGCAFGGRSRTRLFHGWAARGSPAKGIAFLPRREYSSTVETVTIKLAREQIRWLDDQAYGRGRSRSAILRDLIEERRAKRGAVSLHERSKDLCGSFAGPRDLSTRRPKGYGRD